MNIGVDMDRVLIDNGGPWSRYINSQHEAHEHPFLATAIPTTWGYYEDCCKNCFKVCVNSAGILLQSPAMPGAKSGLEELALAGHTLHLISSRPASLVPIAQQLMRRLRLDRYFASMQWNFRPKTQTCRDLEIDLMIDDGPHNITALAPTKTKVLIFDWPYNRHLSGPRVTHWGQVMGNVQILEMLLKVQA